MKLRNKKTGKIVPASNIAVDIGEDGKWYETLAELNEEWEDYEEPKTFWAISWAGEPEEYDGKNTPKELKDMARQIGNIFETREEAEKAVEKLKALKRLKDKGFKFIDWDLWNGIKFKTSDDFYDTNDLILANLRDDLDLLFGGEDE